MEPTASHWLAGVGLALPRRPSSGPSHLVRVGDFVAHCPVEGGASCPVGHAEVLGFTEPDDALAAGVVLRVDGVERVAWTDALAVAGGTLLFRPRGDTWQCQRAADGYWRASLVSPKKAPPKKSAPSKKKPAEPMVSRWVLDTAWQALTDAQRAALYSGPNHLPAGSVLRELGPMSRPVAIDFDADAERLGLDLLSDPPVDALAPAVSP